MSYCLTCPFLPNLFEVLLNLFKIIWFKFKKVVKNFNLSKSTNQSTKWTLNEWENISRMLWWKWKTQVKPRDVIRLNPSLFYVGMNCNVMLLEVDLSTALRWEKVGTYKTNICIFPYITHTCIIYYKKPSISLRNLQP